MIRLIALDLDGTLLDPAGRITQASKDAIARARAAGVRVVLNTGRPIQEAVWFAGEAGCDALLSCLGAPPWWTVSGGRPCAAGTCRRSRAAGRWSCAWAGRSS